MGVPESESTTKRRKRDIDSIAIDHAPLPAPLAPSRAYRHRHLKPAKPIKSIRIRLNKDGSFKPHQPKFEKGTTALAFRFEEGIMVAVDHSSKSSQFPKNVVKLNSHMLATISGGSEFLLEDLQKECYRQEQTEGRKTSGAEALKWLSKVLAGYKKKLSIGILIAVWNELDRGLYRMNGKGEVVIKDVLATGSGGVAASVIVRTEDAPYYPHSDDLQSRYSTRDKRHISVTEAAELAKIAICVAADSAPHSGDTVSVFHLGRDGCEKLIEDDIEEWQKANIKCPRMKFEIIGKGWSDAVA